jgi:small GTP-binding protein
MSSSPSPDPPPQFLITDFIKESLIGNGTYGRVFRARLKSDNSLVALKIILRQSPDDLIYFDRELEILTSQSHPTLLKCLGYVPADPDVADSPALVLELAEGGSIAQHLSTNALPLIRKHLILYGVAVGFSILHEQGIVHRDLKPGNILLNPEFEPIIGDFGSATRLDSTNPQTFRPGTLRFCSPEILGEKQYNTAVDIYSFAMLIYNLFTNRIPFSDIQHDLTVVRKIEKGDRPDLSQIPEPYKQLISDCWNKIPEQRPTMRSIIARLSSYEFFRDPAELSGLRNYQRKIRREAPIEKLPDPKTSILKVVFVGESNAGKSAIFNRIAGRGFVVTMPTVANPPIHLFGTSLRDGIPVLLALHDTAGQEVYQGLTKNYLRDCGFAILVFDITDQRSFVKVSDWNRILREVASPETKLILVGTKVDCEEQRVVKAEQADLTGWMIGAVCYIETSAKTGENIHEIVDQIRRYSYLIESQTLKNTVAVEPEGKEEQRKSCC